jgi:signal recognition particle receptor subunit alpha
MMQVHLTVTQNNLSVLIAACDTFRSGAVEQLQVHSRNLSIHLKPGVKVDVFDNGYGKHPFSIAQAAVSHGIVFGLSR